MALFSPDKGGGSIDFSGVDALMCQGVSDLVFPGAVLLAMQGRSVLYHRAFGVTDLDSKKPVTTGTFFDLASLTKPLATALAVLLLAQEGALSLDQPLGSLLPVFRATSKEAIR